MGRGELVRERWAVRASVAGLLAVLCFLAGFSFLTQRSIEETSRQADRAMRISAIYQDARDWVGEEQSEERRYRFEGSSASASPMTRRDRLVSALEAVRKLDPSPANRATVAQLLDLHTRYRDASRKLFAAVDAGDEAGVQHYDHEVIDPVFGILEDVVSRPGRRRPGDRARTQRIGPGQGRACDAGDHRRVRRRPRPARLLRRDHPALPPPARRRPRRRARASRRDRHQRSAHRPAQPPRVPRGSGAGGAAHQPHRHPLALVLLDVDDLKTVNDEQGHQAGDERLQALADAIRATQRAGDCAYRVGGDEFAITLPEPAPTARWSSRSACARPRSPATMGSRSPSPRASPRRSSSAPRTIWCARPTSR